MAIFEGDHPPPSEGVKV